MKTSKLLILALAVASLAACGGGGGSSTGDSSSGSTPGESGATVGSGDTGSDTSTEPGASTDPDTSSTPTTPDVADNDTAPDQGSGDPVTTEPTGNDETPVETPVVPMVSLSWSIPATREDGTYLPVYEIGGYEVRYSKNQETDVTVIRINDPQTTDWTMENLAPGLYEFSIATIDSEGVYSDFSTTATTSIE